jgi:DNA-directed RNA polymerase specialized sigma24 family protein
VDNDLASPSSAARAPHVAGDRAAVTRSPDEQGDTAGAARAVTALYREHALGLTRLAFLVLGGRPAAEDVVQDAFCGLYRAWDRLPDHDNVRGYLRVSVLNGCRSALRRARRTPRPAPGPGRSSAP